MAGLIADPRQLVQRLTEDWLGDVRRGAEHTADERADGLHQLTEQRRVLALIGLESHLGEAHLLESGQLRPHCSLLGGVHAGQLGRERVGCLHPVHLGGLIDEVGRRHVRLRQRQECVGALRHVLVEALDDPDAGRDVLGLIVGARPTATRGDDRLGWGVGVAHAPALSARRANRASPVCSVRRRSVSPAGVPRRIVNASGPAPWPTASP